MPMYKCPKCGEPHRKVSTMTTHITDKHWEESRELWWQFVEKYFSPLNTKPFEERHDHILFTIDQLDGKVKELESRLAKAQELLSNAPIQHDFGEGTSPIYKYDGEEVGEWIEKLEEALK